MTLPKDFITKIIITKWGRNGVGYSLKPSAASRAVQMPKSRYLFTVQKVQKLEQRFITYRSFAVCTRRIAGGVLQRQTRESVYIAENALPDQVWCLREVMLHRAYTSARISSTTTSLSRKKIFCNVSLFSTTLLRIAKAVVQKTEEGSHDQGKIERGKLKTQVYRIITIFRFGTSKSSFVPVVEQ